MASPFAVEDSDHLNTDGKVLLLTRRDNESHLQVNRLLRSAIQRMGDIDNSDIVAAHADSITAGYRGAGKLSTEQLQQARAIVVDIPSKDLELCTHICEALQTAGVGRRLFFITGNPPEMKDFFERGAGKHFGFHADVSSEERSSSHFHHVLPGSWPKGRQALNLLDRPDLPFHDAILAPKTGRMVNDMRGIVIYDKADSLTNDLAAGVSAVFHLSDALIAQLENGGALSAAEENAFHDGFDAMTQTTSASDRSSSHLPNSQIEAQEAEAELGAPLKPPSHQL
ncbi:MAG: hypothetical protein MRY32_09175 [Rickettsiales bacterium]|nr:hypothetical protein [Rickettsiales bacterium]